MLSAPNSVVIPWRLYSWPAHQCAAVWQPEVALGALQGLNARLLVHTEHNGVLRRIQVQPDDVSRLGGKFRVGADAPASAPLQVNTLAPQHAPDVIRRDIPKGPRQKRTRPRGVARRRRLVQLRQNAPLCLFAVTPLCSGARRVSQASKSLFGKAPPPFAHRYRAYLTFLRNGSGGRAFGCSKDYTGAQDGSLFRSRRPYPCLQGFLILIRKNNRGCFSNHFSKISCHF